MTTKWFVGLQNFNWTRLAIIVGCFGVMWIGFASVVPPKIFGIVGGILGAISNGIAYATRASKYVAERHELPPVGTQP